MAKLDADVRSVIHHLYFKVTDSWENMMPFLWSPDTLADAGFWVEERPERSEVQLKNEIREFIIQADAQMKNLPASDFVLGYPVTDKPRVLGDPRPCFLAMPTKDWLPDVQRVIEEAAAGFECELSVDNCSPGNIMDQVWQSIRRSDVIVADLTGENPNVFYEMGLAHALGKTIVLIKQKETQRVPFDVSSYKYKEYELDRLSELRAWLESAFHAVPRRYVFDSAQ